MSNYVKAYTLDRFRKYANWHEKSENARKELDEYGFSTDKTRELSGDSILYLHGNLVVTDGIFADKNIIFDDVTPEWEKFCKDKLQFAVPEYDQVTAAH